MEKKFKNIIPINGLGLIEEFKNESLIRVRLVKLIKYDSSEDEYRFQYGNEKSNEFLTISGDCYPVHKWKSQIDIEHKTVIKPTI